MSEQTTNAYVIRRFLWYMIGVFFFATLAVSGSLILDNSASAAEADPTKVSGRWLRPDGGYILALSNSTFDGRITAAYFNPHPINVSRAAWKLGEGYVYVFVELKDKGYPGSTYTLAYDSETDRLEGIYYQAAMNQQFEVIFERTEEAGE